MSLLPDDPQALRVMPKTIPATCYNRVRLALIRLGKPLRLDLPQHRGLEMVLTDDAWRCIDTLREDQLVLVWRTFDSSGRDDLTQPVTCELHLYHHCAGLVMGSILGDMEEALDVRIAPNGQA